jgi:hypothetical protein
MKALRILPAGFFLLLSVATLSAQNSLPNPHDDSCWSSLAALRACQMQAYDQAQDYASRCTSYPEYQCLPADKPVAQKMSNKHAAKPGAKTTTDSATSSVTNTASPDDSAEVLVQPSN